jgi:hypothetical protein
MTQFTPRRPRFRRVLLTSSAVVAIVAAGALSAAALRGGSGEPELVDPAGPTLVFAEFGLNADEIYLAPANDPEQRTPLQTIPHAEGWGINPAPQLVAGRTAYTVLPPDASPNRDSPAELWLLDVVTRSATRLSRDADLLAAPVLSADGTTLAYRRTEDGGVQAIVRVDLETRARRVLHAEQSSFGVFPVGFDEDGAVLFARLSADGTDLMRVTDGDRAELLFHASDEIARDWRLSPDGASLAYLAPELTAERVVHRARVVDLAGTEVLTLPADLAEHFAVAWRHDGALAVGREPLGAASAAPLVLNDARTMALRAATTGFDVPLAWSLGGGYLAVRHFDGEGSQNPGTETLVVLGGDGSRVTVSARTELIFLGWTGA